ncbi:MAG TPA: guanylate kinase [Chthoniobacterales bacterium]|jgi:guanylate kinase
MSNSSPEFSRTGILFVLSAPSGAGKTTLTTSLRHKPDFVYAVSCTTRAPRAGEVHGEDYFFLTEEDFKARVAAGEFLEHAEVHGRYYGTLKQTVIEHLSAGVDVLIDIDTQGAVNIRACDDPFIQAALADVFIMPPSLEELRRRLKKRGTETDEQIEVRIRNAATEMKSWRDYRYTLISGSMEEDIEKFRAVMRAERYLSRRLIHHPTA